VNALDNNQARQYTDGKCVFYNKPLFESGTLGTKANTTVCLPGLTPSYSEGVVAGEGQGIAKCTLRNFPSLPLHCIEWAREKFDDFFVVDADNVNSLIEDSNAFFLKMQQSPLEAKDALTAVKKWLNLSKKPSLELCVEIMCVEFTRQFRDQICDLIHNFPADARNTRTTDDGKELDLGPFWHGHKRFPNVADLNVENELHLDFVFHGAAILANVFGLTDPVSREKVAAIAKTYKPSDWKYSGKKVEVEEDKKETKETKETPVEEVADEDAVQVKELTEYLKGLNLKEYKRLSAADFEKDDDKNHHVDFITVATNLRSFNYHIKPSKRSECRMVAGRIIPAIATTTAMITGFVLLEICKYIKEVPLEHYRMATVNLAVNNFTLESLPDPIKKKTGLDQATYMQVSAIPEGWTTWDKIVVNTPDLTLQEFLDGFPKHHHGVKLDSLTTPDGKVLFLWQNKEGFEKTKGKKVVDVYTAVVGPVFPPNRKYLILEGSGEDSEGNTALIPKIVYYFAK